MVNLEEDERNLGILKEQLSIKVSEIIDDPDTGWKDGYTVDDVKNLEKYLRKRNIPIPDFSKIPKDKKEGVVKLMVRTWMSIEGLHLVAFITDSEIPDIDNDDTTGVEIKPTDHPEFLELVV